MDIIEVAKTLIRFKSQTGNGVEINKTMQYIASLFKDGKANIKLDEQVENAPVIFISNTDSQDFDVLVLGHIDV